MKKILFIILVLWQVQTANAQTKFKYGITVGMNISSAILPELKLNTDINSILHGDDVVRGNPELSDFIALYKAGIYIKLDGKIATFKFNVNYTTTNIHKDINALVFSVNAIDINLDYLDFDLTFNLNLSKHFYISLGFIPSYLLSHKDNLNIADFDQRLLAGFGFKFANGMTIDLDTIIGLAEVIDGSYIHNVMIPITFSIPLN